MQREDSLDADSLKYSSYGNAGVDAGAASFDDDAFIALGTLFATLFDLDEYFDCIADVEFGEAVLFFKEGTFNISNGLVHFLSPVN